MEQILLKAEKRNDKGKSIARKLRKEGRIPAILYGRDVDPLPITVSAREWELLSRHVKRNAILNMELMAGEKAESRSVMVKEIQREFVRDKVLHIDFLQVSMERLIEVEISIHLIGELTGTAKDGLVEQHLRSIRVECLPTQIPEKIEIDISELGMGDSVHVGQISIPGVKMVEGADVAIVTIAHSGGGEKVAAVGEEAEKVE
ncbi:MAG: 50S ribosomal protein L25 [Syntrophus sp. (in: bacteria)]|nr:50S ribosomal protein L25 [Syntrophus sp. (in: bacteria)]